jgi:tRNA (cmo5U34)-methyltransferase
LREALLGIWLKMMAATGIPPEGLEGMRQAYAKDVAVLHPKAVADLIESGGFGTPVQFYQAGMIHAWLSRRGPANDASGGLRRA